MPCYNMYIRQLDTQNVRNLFKKCTKKGINKNMTKTCTFSLHSCWSNWFAYNFFVCNKKNFSNWFKIEWILRFLIPFWFFPPKMFGVTLALWRQVRIKRQKKIKTYFVNMFWNLILHPSKSLYLTVHAHSQPVHGYRPCDLLIINFLQQEKQGKKLVVYTQLLEKRINPDLWQPDLCHPGL